MSITDEREKARQGIAKPVPPPKHIRHAGTHWLERSDTDGHTQGLEVFQWQPVVQRWCRPNQYATLHGDVELNNYVYIGPVSLPLEGERRDEVIAILAQMQQSREVGAMVKSDYIRIHDKHYELLRELLYHMV